VIFTRTTDRSRRWDTYDGDGDRVEKSNGKIYWYGAGSQVLDESDGSGNITDEYVYFGGKRVAHRVVSGNSVYYYAEDLLGSSRALATSAGGMCYDADFYPYGGEHDYTNTCAQNYKFTGKERDPETNNDDFDARYYSSAYGRFLSADWSSTPSPVPYANLTNPQTLNLYAMVSDNPESFADLDGHSCFNVASGCGRWSNFLKHVQAAFAEATVRATIGLGWGEKGSVGRLRGKLELGMKANLTFSKGKIKVSMSTDGGADLGLKNVKNKIGLSYADDKVVGSYDVDSNKSGPAEPATSETTVLNATTHKGASATSDSVGYEDEVGDGALAGGGVTLTHEGWGDLAAAGHDLLDAIDTAMQPPPPPAPTPPSPPQN
jgi:RHS repeat-associated protein